MPSVAVAPSFAATPLVTAVPLVNAAAMVAASATAFVAIDQLYEDAVEDNVPVQPFWEDDGEEGPEVHLCSKSRLISSLSELAG